jgi:hypothetical protein
MRGINMYVAMRYVCVCHVNVRDISVCYVCVRRIRVP